MPKRDNKPPMMARYSSYGDKSSSIYLEINDIDPSVPDYTEKGHVDSVHVLDRERLDYNPRPPPEIPRVNGVHLDGANKVDAGYEKIKESQSKVPYEELGKSVNVYAKLESPKREFSDEKVEVVTGELDDTDDTYSKVVRPNKKMYHKKPGNPTDKQDDYTRLKKKIMFENDHNERINTGTDHSDLKDVIRDYEILMEDNADIYIPADEIEGIKTDHEEKNDDIAKGNEKKKNQYEAETADKEETKWYNNEEVYNSNISLS